MQDLASRTTLVTWLEMTAPPPRAPAPPPIPGVEVRHARAPTTSFYRELYGGVGEAWTWVTRRVMSDEALSAIIGDPRVEIHVLWVEGAAAGYVELDRRFPPDIEIAYFGLMPACIGRGLGRWCGGWGSASHQHSSGAGNKCAPEEGAPADAMVALSRHGILLCETSAIHA